MPIDKAQLTAYLDELGLTDTVRSSVLAELESKPDAATKFVGQRLRHDDYTRKAMELATNKQTLEAQVSQQIAGYASELQKANEKAAKIASDFENERISRATADARLAKVKTMYDLSDEDIPPVDQILAKPSTEPAIDITKTLADFRAALLTDIRKDLAAMPSVTATQFDIAAQHQDLFGKRLTRDEMTELVTIAQKNGSNLTQAWESKHGVGELRTTKLVESEVAKARTKWEDDARTAASNAAMSSITAEREGQSFTGTSGTALSPVLGRKYGTDGVDATPQGSQKSDPPPAAQATSPQGQGANKLSGAERAAAKWMQKAHAGTIGKVA